MGFLGDLADQINSQFSAGENTVHSLDDVESGQKYGSLGDFAKHFDQSAERRYVEEGYLRKDAFNTDPKQYEILMQEPNATVLVKKRMFSSISENYRPDYMDKDEKLYYKAMKVLFQNKCRQIAALEKLSKIQKITSAVGNISDQLMPLIISLTDDAGSGFSVGGPGLFGGSNSGGEVGSFTKVIDRMRRLYAFNTTNPLTTWITDPTNLFQSQFGQGTGVIEITNFTNLTTNITVDIKSPGSFTFNIQDPYEAMLITEYDIERAISDATNSNYNHKIFQFGQQGAEQVINDATVRLNQLRSLRKASPITFRVSPDTLLGKRVVAIIDRIGTELPFEYDSSIQSLLSLTPGNGVKVAASYLFQTGNKTFGDVAGFDGLDVTPKSSLGPDSNIRALSPESEFSVFQRLVTAIFSKLQLDANSRGAFVTTNKNTNYARRKLRFNFSGKLIIQPMDTVHIYMNSKSRFDNKLLGGLNNMFTGDGILQNINKTITDFKNAADTLFNPSGSVNFQAEKNSYVGADFPNFLWSLIRGQFVTEKEGTHVFAGIVQGATDNWADGKFNVDVRGTDNTAYFDMGKINFKPGVDVFAGSLFDPLTPFKSRFDDIVSNAKDQTPTLLDENLFMMGTSTDKSSPLVKLKLGPNAGQPSHSDSIIQDVSVDKSSRDISKIFYAPDGLVYKWKEGIGTLVQFGGSTDLNDSNKVGIPALTKEPFAGQDVMNVISLLITGQPYNFANYWKTVANFDGFKRDPQSQQDAAYSYYDSLRSDLTKNNIIWGNFIPFKNLVMDEQSFSMAMKTQFRILENNQNLTSKLQKLAEAQRRVDFFAASKFDADPNLQDRFDNNKKQAQAIVDQLKTDVNKLIAETRQADQSKNAQVVSASDVSYDYNEFLDNGDPNRKLSDASSRRLLRRQTNYLTRRMSYNVRANEDKNLFIVDDYYDKDFDILAYEQSLADGIKLYNNEFTSVKDKIIVSAELLNLEVFCDTQGHIRVRPPQYNRMPSSIFYRMMFLKKSLGIQVFPQFLDDVFGDQINILREKVEIIEDQIRLDCAVLGIATDQDSDQTADWKCIAFVTNYGASSGNGDPFVFLSSPSGAITDLTVVKDAANPDKNPLDNIKNSASFTNLKGQANSTKNAFTNSQRFDTILTALTNNKLNLAGYGINDKDAFLSNTRINTLIDRIKNKSGQQISRTSYLVTTDLLNNSVVLPAGQSIDVFKTTQELADRIRQRQSVARLLYNALKNSIEAHSLADDNETGNSLLTPGNFGNSNTPEIFEHMIEDESYDDYGPGSGSRYIIKRSQIKSISIAETPPDFTMIEVRGVLNTFAPNALPNDLNSFPLGGNGLVTGAAIDYDMWRNYGFRGQSPINVPFLSDPNTQCAPYASMILSRARKNILRGTVTIAGNEFMQPGEVVFLQDRNMLFYVNAVRHSFTYGSGFTTSLDLTYGHTPGEYIPTTLDVIGKLIYNNRDTSGVVVQRQSRSSTDSNVGVIIKDSTSAPTLSPGNATDPITSFSAANNQTINNILYTTRYIINSNNTKGNTIKASLELRVYYDNHNVVNDELMAFAQQVEAALTTVNTQKQPLNNTTGSPGNQTLSGDDVSIVPINLGDLNTHQSGSQKAMDAARNMVQANSLGGGGGLLSGLGAIVSASVDVAKAAASTVAPNLIAQQEQAKLRTALFKYVVDCWVKFTPVSPAVAAANGS